MRFSLRGCRALHDAATLATAESFSLRSPSFVTAFLVADAVLHASDALLEVPERSAKWTLQQPQQPNSRGHVLTLRHFAPHCGRRFLWRTFEQSSQAFHVDVSRAIDPLRANLLVYNPVVIGRARRGVDALRTTNTSPPGFVRCCFH